MDNNAKYTAKDLLQTVIDTYLYIQRSDHTDERTKIIAIYELEMRHGKAKRGDKN